MYIISRLLAFFARQLSTLVRQHSQTMSSYSLSIDVDHTKHLYWCNLWPCKQSWNQVHTPNRIEAKETLTIVIVILNAFTWWIYIVHRADSLRIFLINRHHFKFGRTDFGYVALNITVCWVSNPDQLRVDNHSANAENRKKTIKLMTSEIFSSILVFFFEEGVFAMSQIWRHWNKNEETLFPDLNHSHSVGLQAHTCQFVRRLDAENILLQ